MLIRSFSARGAPLTLRSFGQLNAFIVIFLFIFCGSTWASPSHELDTKVSEFLERRDLQWRDLNIPFVDGQVLYDIIVKNNYTKAVEIGTSTGHSALWIAWAMSKTGGKLITIEIDERRYKEALKNFESAGLSAYIEPMLGDAHTIVPELEGPFDFVFSDADKEWYLKYFEILAPKLEVGGCFTAHNVLNIWMRGMNEFLDAINNHNDFETTIDNTSKSGISISYKKPALKEN